MTYNTKNIRVEKIKIEDDKILYLSLDALEDLVTSADASRKVLNNVAQLRFNMTSSELSRLPNNAKLTEQLKALINNKKVH